MKKTIALLFLSNVLFSQNTPTEVVSGLTPGLYALDIYDNNVYFTKTSFGQHLVGRVNLTNPNSTPEIINNNVFTPFGITINNDALYFTELLPRRISKINLTNNPSWNTEILPISWQDEAPWGIKIYDQELYFSESVMNIKKVPLSNISQTPQLVCTNIPHQFSFIKEGNFIYSTAFADDLVNNIFKIDINEPLGTIPENLGAILEPMSMVKMENLIFVSTNDSKIFKINLNNSGSEPELFYQVTDAESSIGNIKEYNNELYFTYNEFDINTETVEGKIMKFTQSQLSNANFSRIENFTIFPNPASNILNIELVFEVEKITFYDLLGNKIDVKNLSKNAFDISNLSSGFYLINIQSQNNHIATLKFLKN
jgi:Secretion system C-terminal sorting domain